MVNNLKCGICGFENKHGVKTQNGFFCERDFSNPNMFMIPRIQSDYGLGKIQLDSQRNRFARSKEPQYSAAILTKKTKRRIEISDLKFLGVQKTLCL